MARGRFDHTMDGKGRINVPQLLRAELEDAQGEPPVLTYMLDPAVAIYSHDEVRELERRLGSMSHSKGAVQKLRRMFIGGAVDCPIDSQGRVVVPPHLREHAGLEREVTLVGVGPRIELWDRARFDAELQSTRDDGENIADIAADLGF